jgi:ATP-binding cassette subfamily B protein
MVILQRCYELKEGKILIDDNDFMNYTKQEIRSNIGYVLQEPAIFSGTIKSNITFGIDATDEEVEKVLEMIGATKFVKDYPNGINTNLDYLGGNLSTGEKQLISFARILLRNPSIIILDEATANIDTETEILIQNALKVLASGRTTFVVAHRLSTIRNADNIYVLDDGKIVEEGTHDELYALNGKYRQMYEAQYDKNRGK